jgi:hypothetical protein
MRVKEGVIRAGLAIEMRPVERIAEEIWKRQGKVIDLGKEIDLAIEGVTITAALDGVHSAGSLHPCGYAEDLRTRYFSKEQVKAIASGLVHNLKAISIYYQVIVEKDHIHVEYDREVLDIR